jgi:formate dehydrogenase subunit delta
MSARKLTHMANQIAAFFRSQPQAQAAAGVAEHIRSFWSPVMRRDAYAHLDAGGEGLDPLAREALEMLRAQYAAAAK